MANIAKIMNECDVYVPTSDDEGYQVIANFPDEGYFLGYGEETGEEYSITYDEVDVENAIFYKLVRMDINSFGE